MHRIARLLLAPIFALALLAGPLPIIDGTTAEAASCVRFSTGNFDAVGNDNYAQYLNGEWVRIKNYCATSKLIGGWKIHDYGRKHTYTIPSGIRIGAGRTITLYSGKGTRTTSKLYWGRSYGAVWNNTPPERAYLRNTAGTLMSSWSEY